MKKLVSLAVLTALVSGCADLSTTSRTNGYGADGFGEETLVTTPMAEQSLNTDAYLMAPAPKYYIGSAYKVEDVQYIPVEDMSYNQTGVAGIIPTELNGTKTSNGETFDASQLVATSKTLPLPTIARVTNLDNGQSVVVRVNNRGPFVNTRIMDLSPAAAQRIGLNGQGKIQVQVMVDLQCNSDGQEKHRRKGKYKVSFLFYRKRIFREKTQVPLSFLRESGS